MWEAQTPWITRLLPVGHTGALGNISGQEGHFGAGSCVISQGKVLSLVSRGQLLGSDSWPGQRGQCFPSPTFQVAASLLQCLLSSRPEVPLGVSVCRKVWGDRGSASSGPWRCLLPVQGRRPGTPVHAFFA